MHTFFLAPIGYNVGLTSVSLGMVRALEQAGLSVGFVKPVAQGCDARNLELSTHFARAVCHTQAPEPLPLERVERLLGQGQTDQIMEEIISLCRQAARDVDVVVVEGMVPDQEHVFASSLNTLIARNLGAHTILVGSVGEQAPAAVAEQLDIGIQAFGGNLEQIAGVILNRAGGSEAEHAVLAASKWAGNAALPLLGRIPFKAELIAPRTQDVANHLGAQVRHPGLIRERRVQSIVVTSRTAPNMVHLLKPGALIVTSGDREDVIFATAIATMNGVPLAGVVFTCDAPPDERIQQLCQQAFTGNLPVLVSAMSTFDTSSLLTKMSQTVPADDTERMERVIEHIAEHLDTARLKQFVGEPHELRLTPPAFRYQLREKARAANKRIVLPEGNEPRTIKAAAICQEKGIARCVLLGDRGEIERIAQAQGVALPAGLEILDPAAIRPQYVAPMVELRKGKGLSAPMAEEQLEDNVVLGTMMLALDEVDGLVSGAVHTTANTIRPALQLIKTAPGARLVSSVFFMLMPEQVLVYGDCAVNPDPSPEELADIAIQSADSAIAFGIEPRVAMISYSTGSSGSGSDVEKVREATRLAREKRPELDIDGPMQYDAASVESVGRQKAPGSKVAGRATVFVFPDLNTGNTTYKAVQRSANVVSVGPMLQGLRKPVNDLSRGALVDDIVYTIALTALQAAAR